MALLKKIKSLPFKRIFKWAGYLVLFTGIIILFCNAWIIKSTKSQIYNDVSKIGARTVGLVLGTNKFSRGKPNLFFNYRIEAAVQLFKAGKIKHIIVSGDNSKEEYDESTDMHDALVEAGIPDTCITMDFAGFRTLDSVVRCLKVFGQTDVIIISQEFHNERALFIANYYKMNALAFSTKEVPMRYSIKTSVREYFAKCKAVLDLYVLHKQPHFLGEEVKIRI
ncbi:MAG: putative rane protein [Bacteroidetes bacterium]|nr:putative rane protein [Bacteroidota bacterium]